MASGKKGIEAGRAYVKAYLDDSLVGRGLKRMAGGVTAFGGKLKSIGVGMAGLAGAVVAPLVGAAKTFADMGSDLLDLSQRTGVSVEALSELKYAADQSGSSIEGVEKGLRGMARTMLDAERGSAEAVDSMRDLGLSLDDLQGKSPEQQFMLFANAISGIEDPSRRAALAMKVFGKSGAELLPLFADGVGGINKLREEAQALGISMSTEDAVAAEKFGDQMSTLSAVLKMKVFSAGAAVAPMLGRLSDFILKGSKATSDWIKANRPLIAGLFAGAVALGVMGAAFIGLGAVITVVGTVIGGVTAAVGFLLSPVGLLLAALAVGATAGAYFAHQSGLLGRTLDWLRTTFGPLIDEVMRFFQAMKDALRAGDFEAAAALLWAGLRAAWLKGKVALLKVWDDLTSGLRTAWGEVLAGLTGKFTEWGEIAKAVVHDILARLNKARAAFADLIGSDDMAAAFRANVEAHELAAFAHRRGAASRGEKATTDVLADNAKAAEERKQLREEQEAEAAKAKQEFETAVAAANAAGAAFDAAEAAKAAAVPTDTGFDEGAQQVAQAAKPAINTAAIVGSQSGAEAVLKATQGFRAKVTPDGKLLAGKLDANTAALKEIAKNAIVLAEGDTI